MKYKPYQVSIELYNKMELDAKRIRKKTGANVTWTMVLKQILKNHYKKNSKISIK